MRSFLHNYKVSVPVIGAVLVGLFWVAFGFFGVHTLFIDDEVSEAAPVFDTPVAAEPASSDGAAVVTDDTEVPSVTTAPLSATPDATDDTADGDEAGADESAAPTAAPLAGEPTQEPAEEPAQEIVAEFAGTFIDGEHPTSGVSTVLGNGTGQRFLRFENFETDNGPDLNVYLFNNNGDESDYIDLGDLKGNIGEQNYEIPTDVDLSVYSEVSIWCVRFGVGFGSASLTVA